MLNVGDKVKLLESVYEHPGETPGGYYAMAGDTLVIRGLNPGRHFPVSVSHEDVLDSTFGVYESEVEKIG